jgi:hypothetical protein
MESGGINPFIDRDDVLSQIVGEFAAQDPPIRIGPARAEAEASAAHTS